MKFSQKESDKMATMREVFSEQSSHPLEESNGNGRLRLAVTPQTKGF